MYFVVFTGLPDLSNVVVLPYVNNEKAIDISTIPNRFDCFYIIIAMVINT